MSNTYIGRGASVLTPHGHKRSSERARRGSRSDRFELRHNDCAIAKKPQPLDCVEDRQRIEREEEPRGVFQKYGTAAWYGWSMFLAPDFPTLAPMSVTVVQAKPPGYTPIWDLNLGGPARVFFWDENSDCTVGQLSNWRGRWTDLVVFADYSPSPSGPAFQMWVNNRLVCTRTRPLIVNGMPGDGKNLHIRYGLYQAYISRWLGRTGRTPPEATGWRDVNSQPGFGSNSLTPTPFAYDWGVKLPTTVLYIDEFRSGPTRESVDVGLLEARGVKPVD